MPERYVFLQDSRGWATLGDYKIGRKLDLPPPLARAFLATNDGADADLRLFLRANGWDHPSRENLRAVLFLDAPAAADFRSPLLPNLTTVYLPAGKAWNPACRRVPLRIYLGTFNGCNCECSYCCARGSRSRPGLFGVAEVAAISAHLYRLGIIEIRLGESGEPTQHPDFPAIASAVKQTGLYVSLNTNGVMSDTLRDFIARSGCVDLLIQSLDGIGDAHDRNRGRGAFEQAMKTVQAVHGHVKLRFNYVVNNETQASLEDLADLAFKYNAEIFTLPMRPSGRALKDFETYVHGLSWERLIARMDRVRHSHPGLVLHSTYDILTPRGDHLVDHVGSCPAGIEGCCVSPAVDDPGTGPSRIRLFGCSFLVDAAESIQGQTRHPFLARLFSNSDEFAKDFLTAWHEDFDVFRGSSFRDAHCSVCPMLKGHRCTGHCAALGYYRQQHPSFDPSMYCAMRVSGS